jgi:hypothetical protein
VLGGLTTLLTVILMSLGELVNDDDDNLNTVPLTVHAGVQLTDPSCPEL